MIWTSTVIVKVQILNKCLNPLLDENILDWSKLKQIADDI